DMQRIQKAIDEVSDLPKDTNGFRGAVLLKRGTYRISNQLRIADSGVVLRGQGDGEDGTILIASGNRKRDLISVKGASGPRERESTQRKITDDYVPVGARNFTVDSPGTLKVGDTVFVRRVGNREWIHFI